jgi:hypothetical protein
MTSFMTIDLSSVIPCNQGRILINVSDFAKFALCNAVLFFINFGNSSSSFSLPLTITSSHRPQSTRIDVVAAACSYAARKACPTQTNELTTVVYIQHVILNSATQTTDSSDVRPIVTKSMLLFWHSVGFEWCKNRESVNVVAKFRYYLHLPVQGRYTYWVWTACDLFIWTG